MLREAELRDQMQLKASLRRALKISLLIYEDPYLRENAGRFSQKTRPRSLEANAFLFQNYFREIWIKFFRSISAVEKDLPLEAGKAADDLKYCSHGSVRVGWRLASATYYINNYTWSEREEEGEHNSARVLQRIISGISILCFFNSVNFPKSFSCEKSALVQ